MERNPRAFLIFASGGNFSAGSRSDRFTLDKNLLIPHIGNSRDFEFMLAIPCVVRNQFATLIQQNAQCYIISLRVPAYFKPHGSGAGFTYFKPWKLFSLREG
jgi:hypothetical protein